MNAWICWTQISLRFTATPAIASNLLTQSQSLEPRRANDAELRSKALGTGGQPRAAACGSQLHEEGWGVGRDYLNDEKLHRLNRQNAFCPTVLQPTKPEWRD